jgi:hypothetical protein
MRATARGIRLAVDHVASIDHHGGHLGDAQSPGIGDALVGAADAALKCLAAIAQRCCTSAAAGGVGRQARGQFGLDALGQVQLDHARAGCGLHGMAAVGDDQHVGCGCVWPSRHSGSSRAGDARAQRGMGFKKGAVMAGVLGMRAGL